MCTFYFIFTILSLWMLLETGDTNFRFIWSLENHFLAVFFLILFTFSSASSFCPFSSISSLTFYFSFFFPKNFVSFLQSPVVGKLIFINDKKKTNNAHTQLQWRLKNKVKRIPCILCVDQTRKTNKTYIFFTSFFVNFFLSWYLH